MNPTRRPWKLITVSALATMLTLCVCATLSLTVFQRYFPSHIWIGNSYFHITEHPRAGSGTSGTIVAISQNGGPLCYPTNVSFSIGNLEFRRWDCIP